ncbi:hypothetical protein ACS0TY_010222 [Phlomoides rotata]
MDCKIVYDALRSSDRCRSIFGDIIHACKLMFPSIQNIRFNWVVRNANGFAHAIARNARGFPSPY